MKARDAKENPLRAVAVAVFVMFAVSAFLLLLLAGILYKLEPEESVIRIGIVAVYVITGLFGGFLTGKIMQEKKYLWGLLAGILYFAILFLVSVLVNRGFQMQWMNIFTTLILCGASAMAGGMIS